MHKYTGLNIIVMCQYFLVLTNQALMYLSDKPNYPLIRSLLDSLQEDLRFFIDPPDGTKQHPATTCLELMLSHPNLTSGQGHSHECFC